MNVKTKKTATNKKENMRNITNAKDILLNILYETEADPFLSSEIKEFVASMELISSYAGCEDLPNDFSPYTYFMCNIDLFRKGVDPWGHYLNSGKDEGRQY